MKDKIGFFFKKKNKPDVLTKIFNFSEKKVILETNFIQIPASTAFGTGKHYSTFLTIKNIEMVKRKKKGFKSLDLMLEQDYWPLVL